MTHSLKKNYLYNVMYQVISIIVPFITTPYISRVLGADAIGEYSYTASIVTYFSIAATMGLAMYGQREIAYVRNDRGKRSILFFEVELYKLLTTTVCVILFLMFAFRYSSSSRRILYLVQTTTIISVFFDISWFYQGLEEFRITVFRNLLIKIIGAISIFVFVHTKDDLLLYVGLHCLIVFVSNAMLWLYLGRYISFPSVRDLRPFRFTWTMLEMFIPLIAIQVYTVLDKTMIGRITQSAYENGCYEQTTKMINMVMALVTSLGTVMLPRMAAVYAEHNDKRFEELATKAFHYVILLACPLCAGLIAVSANFVPIFYGPGYDRVIDLLRIYSFVLIIIPLSNIAGYAILMPMGQHNKGTIAVVTGAFVNFSLNLFLIAIWKSIGAAVATIVAESVVTLIHLYFVRKKVSLSSIGKYYIRNVLTAAVMGIFVYLIRIELVQVGMKPIVVLLIQILSGVIFYYVLIAHVVKDESLRQVLLSLLRRR